MEYYNYKNGFENKIKKHINIFMYCMLALTLFLPPVEMEAVSTTDTAWDKVLQDTGLINNELMMRFLTAMNYRKFDINRFIENQDKFDHNLFYWLATENFSSGQMREAEACMTALLSADKGVDNYSKLYVLMGNVKLFLKKNEEAALYFKKAISAGSNEVYSNLALVYFLLDDKDSFEKLIPELMKRKSNDLNALEILIAYSGREKDIKLFRETICGIDNKRLAEKTTILSNVIGMLRFTGDKNDTQRADDLQKILLEKEQPKK